MSVAHDLQTNPLINPPKLRHDAMPLDIVRTEHFMPALEYGIARHVAELEAIKNAPPSYKNTIEALAVSGEDLRRVTRVYGILSATSNNNELKALTKELTPKLVAHGNNVNLDEDLFLKVKAVYEDPQSAYLPEDQKRLLTKMYKDYVFEGAELNDQQKEKLREIDRKLAVATDRFSENVSDSRGSYRLEVPVGDLAGVPEDVVNSLIAAAKKSGVTDDKVTVKLDASLYTILDYAENRELRKTLTIAMNNVAYDDPKYDNRPTTLEIVQLRHERAQLFGYANHAKMTLTRRMARDVKTVNDFLEDNLKVYKPAAEDHLQKIRNYAAAHPVFPVSDLKPWDTGYYSRLLKQETFQVDMNEIRQYFSLDNALKALHYHAEKAFGLELREQPYPVHKKSVKVYEVFNKASGALKSLFYTNYTEDQDVNSQKRGGAWMDAPRVRSVVDGVTAIPLVTNDCNYPAQVEGEPPVLISKDDWQTIFHEFGHALHAMLYDGEIAELSGPNVAWDAVEGPSQLQENWINDRELLKKFALHNVTGQPIPDALLDKMDEMERFGAGMSGLGQTSYGMLDMHLYTIDPAKITSIEDLEAEIAAKTRLMPSTGGSRLTSFTHIMSGGYSAGYYSYKWAEVMSSHVYGKLFQGKDIYDREAMAKVEKHIYADGNRHDQADEFFRVVNEKPNPKYLYEREGVLPVKPAAPAAPANNNAPWPFPKSAP